MYSRQDRIEQLDSDLSYIEDQGIVSLNSEEGDFRSSVIYVTIPSIPSTSETSADGLDVSQIEEKQLGVDRIYNYYIRETSGNPIAFSAGHMLGLFLEVLGGTGGIYAWPPAWDYAKSKNLAPWLAYSFAITNPMSNVLFLIKATDDLFDIIPAELRPPEEIKDLINVPTKKQLASKYAKMIVGSVICAVPFGVAVYLFPLPGCYKTACLSLTIADSIASNTILHAVSWNLILSPQYWYYRLPIIPFEKLYSFISTCRSTKAQVELSKLSGEQEKIYSRYKNILASAFVSKAEKIVEHYIKKVPSSSEVLRSIQNDDMTLIKFAELATKYYPLVVQEPQPSYFRKMINATDRFLLNGPVGVAGAGILVTGCIGWVANSFYVGTLAGLTIPENFVTGILPAYSTAVLCAFYGSAIFKQIYSYLTTWHGIRDKFSLEGQLFPKTFALFLLANLYVSSFAYASGYELISVVFSDPIWDDIRPTLLYISIPTLQILSFIPLTSLFGVVMRKMIAKFGSSENDDTLAARLLVKIGPIQYYLQQMNGDALMEDIKKLTDEQQKILGMDPDEFKKDCETLQRLNDNMNALDIPETKTRPNTSKSYVSCCGIFGKRTQVAKNENTFLLESNLTP